MPPRKHGYCFTIEWLAERVHVELNGCWSWTGTSNSMGYGTAYTTWSPEKLAHRLVYTQLIGPISEGLVLDHLCRRPPCVNPDHLDPCSRGENVVRGDTVFAALARVTVCPHGHEYTPENTVVTRAGTRRCKACQRKTASDYYYAKRRAAHLIGSDVDGRAHRWSKLKAVA